MRPRLPPQVVTGVSREGQITSLHWRQEPLGDQTTPMSRVETPQRLDHPHVSRWEPPRIRSLSLTQEREVPLCFDRSRSGILNITSPILFYSGKPNATRPPERPSLHTLTQTFLPLYNYRLVSSRETELSSTFRSPSLLDPDPLVESQVDSVSYLTQDGGRRPPVSLRQPLALRPGPRE